MRLAYILMGPFDWKTDRSSIHDGTATIVGVSSLEDACAAAKELQASGIQCIELCGAFEEKGARKVIEATGGKIPIGYSIHLPEQDALFTALFGS